MFIASLPSYVNINKNINIHFRTILLCQGNPRLAIDKSLIKTN